jgi:hypothetical protein
LPKQLVTEIKINASPEKVWSILFNTQAYPAWNPFIPSLDGEFVEGKKIKVRLQPPGASGMTFKPVVRKVIPGSEIRWLGHLLFPGIFDGEHCFELKADGSGGTIFTQSERFGGILVPLLSKMIDGSTRKGFELMNERLKAEAEK